MSLGIIISKVRRNIQDNGLVPTIKKSLAAILSVVYESRRYVIYRRHITEADTRLDLEGCPFDLRLVEPDEAVIIGQIEKLEEWLRGKVAEMLQEGSICVVALHRDTVAGFNLVSLGEVYMPIVNLHRTFRPVEAWSEQITVNREYRGQGLATILRRQAFAELFRLGIKRFYGGTLPSNTPNRKLSRKVGFSEIADIRYRKLLISRLWTWERLRDER